MQNFRTSNFLHIENAVFEQDVFDMEAISWLYFIDRFTSQQCQGSALTTLTQSQAHNMLFWFGCSWLAATQSVT